MFNIEPFESPKLLIEGAIERLAELESVAQAFTENCPYRFIEHFDAKTREKVIKIRFEKRLPPRINLLTSHIINELRHSLDQAVCDGSLELGRDNAKNVYFPFGKSEADLRSEVTRKCRRVDTNLVNFILTFKPHYGGDKMLWTLSRLAGYKHQRVINVTLQDTAAFAEAITFARGPLQISINKWTASKNELEVARLPAGSKLHIKNNFIPRFNIVFGESGEAVKFRPLISSLHEFVCKVDGIVSGIEAETGRLRSLPINHETTP